MNSPVCITLHTSADQHARLVALQSAFADVCNALSPTVQATRTWNRVALHHLAYRELRERFPSMGSQMVCNAIYSVSRACRIVFQTQGSPFHISNLSGKPLPLLRFTYDSPVYFDRHTLSIKAGVASMYTLDGRMKFQLELRPEDEESFHERKLREIVLLRRGERFDLQFIFGERQGQLGDPEVAVQTAQITGVDEYAGRSLLSHPAQNLPEYLQVEESH